MQKTTLLVGNVIMYLTRYKGQGLALFVEENFLPYYFQYFELWKMRVIDEISPYCV